MDLVDLVIIGALCYAAAVGYRRGLTYSLFSLAGLVIGLVVGSWLAATVPPLFHHYSVTIRSAIAIGLVLALAFLGDALGGLLGARLRVTTLRSHLGRLDSVAGTAWALLVVLAVSWFLGLVFDQGPIQPLAAQIQGSTILRTLDRDLPQGPAWLGDLQHVFNAVPFPEVFANLVPPLPGPVTLPANLRGDAAVSRDAAETVKVVSVGCGGLIEGSGFPIAPDVILTNAHVVAGGHSTTVQIPGRAGSLAARVVFFDPHTDLALLLVPGLNLTPLAFSNAGTRGAQGAVIGYPGGGVEQVVPGAIRGQIQAVGRDIYSQGLVSRQIYVLEASVIPGNSGGPFVNLQGQVLGVVFAKSLVTGNEGYALTAKDVAPDIAKGQHDTAAVSTQACVE
ncbi:MAG: MarP family serine protease [Candidatus Dormibacteria bacterium]